MSYVESPVVKVRCDAKGHVGPDTFALQFGTALTAQVAIMRAGFSRNPQDTRHRCPDCRRVRGGMN